MALFVHFLSYWFFAYILCFQFCIFTFFFPCACVCFLVCLREKAWSWMGWENLGDEGKPCSEYLLFFNLKKHAYYETHDFRWFRNKEIELWCSKTSYWIASSPQEGSTGVLLILRGRLSVAVRLAGTPAQLLETRLTSLRCHCNLMAECHRCPKAKLLHSAVKQEPGPHCCGFPSAFWWQLGGEQCGIASSRSQVRPGRVDLEPIQKTGYTQTSSGSHMHLDKTWHQRGWGTVR